MIWFTIALFFVSFLVTALLAPKPEVENARAGSLDDVQFPQATEDAPVPLVLGKVRCNGPNTLWYGDFLAEPIKEKIKTGLFSSTKVVVGHKYYLGLDLGLCLGPGVALREIFIDEESVWTGSTSTSVATTGTISAAELFGGYKAGGGWVGSFTFYPGSFTQPVNAYLEGVIGAGLVPGYRGMARLVLEHNYIGESNSLRKMGFVVERYTNALGLPDSGRVGDDMNAMEALYQVLTDSWSGLGVPSSLVDNASLYDAGVILHGEGNGCSVLVTSASDGKAVIKEILRQVDAIMFQDPESGKLKIKLIRQDYDTADLPHFDENDILAVRSFTKTAWEDVIAQVKVSFPQRDKESSAVAISQDMATAAMIGRLKTTTMSFPFCYSPTLAANIASRERAQQSVPLFRMTLELNRNAYTLRPGDVFTMSWPEYGLVNLVMRVQKHDMGELLNNKIVIDAIQDSFAVGTTVFSAPTGSAWVPPVSGPASIFLSEIVDLPRFWGRQLDYPVQDGQGSVIPFALRPQVQSTGFSVQMGGVSGDLDVFDVQFADYPATGTLLASYPQTAGVATGSDATGFTLANVVGTFSAGTDSTIKGGLSGLIYVDGEWMGFSGATVNVDLTVTLSGVKRGLLGTQVKAHSAGARVWQFDVELLGTGVIGSEVTETGTVYYKLLDVAAGIVKDPGSVAQSSKVMQDVADRPLRPRNIQVDATRTGIVISDTSNHSVTWSASNRNSAVIPYETDAAEVPDQTETYDVDVYVDGVKNTTLSAAGVTSPFSMPTSATVINSANCELRIKSRRTVGDLKSSVYYAWLPFQLSQIFTIGDLRYYDTFSGISAANLKGVYALKRRVSTYTGPLVRVRDTVGGAEQDVGQDANGNLASFTVSGEARVVTWYDQSGNGMNLTQATAANQPRLRTAVTPARRARIEFGSSAGGGSHVLRSPNFSTASPNALAVTRPTWFGSAEWVADTAYQYAFNVPQIAGSSPAPYYRFGILHEPDEGFEHRLNGNIYTYAGTYASNVLGFHPWMLDAKSQTNVRTYYDRMDAVAGDHAETAAITYPSTTNFSIGSRGDIGEVWHGSTSEVIIMDNPTTSQSRDAIARQIYFWNDNVTLLCSFDGADAATASIDKSKTAHVLTFNGNAQLDTAQKKWGSASLLLDGTGDYVSAPNSSEHRLSGDFTIEAWIYPTALGGFKAVAAQWNDTGNQKGWSLHLNGSTPEFVFSTSGSGVDLIVSGGTIATGSWQHVAVTRAGSTVRLFVNGALVATGTNGTAQFASTALLTIGAIANPASYFTGWVDEVRVVNNRAIWTTSFTPPIQANDW